MTEPNKSLKPLNEYPLTAHLPTDLASMFSMLRGNPTPSLEGHPQYESVRLSHLLLVKRAALYSCRVDNSLVLWLTFLAGGNPARLVMLLHSLVTNTDATQSTLGMKHYVQLYGRKIPIEQSYLDMWEEQKLGGANLLDIRFWERKQ